MNAGRKLASKLLIGAAGALLIGGCGREPPPGRNPPTASAQAAPTGAAAKTADTAKARFWKPIDY